MSDYAFKDAYLSHQKFGAKNATENGMWGQSVFSSDSNKAKKRKGSGDAGDADGAEGEESQYKKRIRNDNAADVDNYLGPWGGFEGENKRKDFWKDQQEEFRKDEERAKLEEAENAVNSNA